MNRVFRNLDDYEIIYPNIVGAEIELLSLGLFSAR
jgi:hypothetical protein